MCQGWWEASHSPKESQNMIVHRLDTTFQVSHLLLLHPWIGSSHPMRFLRSLNVGHHVRDDVLNGKDRVDFLKMFY